MSFARTSARELPDAPPETVLALSGIAKSFGGLAVLKQLDLRVHRGEVFGFLGRNGAGKSTAIRILMGLTQPDAGTVELFGQSLDGHVTSHRQRIGYVAQNQAMYPWMTPAVLSRFVRGFYPKWDKARYAELIERFDLPTGRRIGTFSGGMRARLALAVALSVRPELLVLDEPTAGMDPVARREFLDLVRDQSQRDGCTTFFSTHLVDEIEAAADRIGIVDDGRTLYEGALQPLVDSMAAWSIDDTDCNPGDMPIEGAEPGFRLVTQSLRRGRRQLVLQFTGAAPRPGVLPLAPGWQRDALSLEDIFVALVSHG